MLNIEETEKEPTTAREVLSKKGSALMTLNFILERFIDYVGENADWKVKLEPFEKQFAEYMETVAPEAEIGLGVLVDNGLMFMSTHPMFAVSEFIKLGANLTHDEKKKFGVQLKEAIERPSRRKLILPYIATVGYKLIQLLMKEESIMEQVEKKKAAMTEVIAASLVRAISENIAAPYAKGTRMLDRLEDVGIMIDNHGNVTDEKGLLKREKDIQDNYGRIASKENTAGEGPESVPPTPEVTD